MSHRAFRVVGRVCAVVLLLAATTGPLASSAFAQSKDAKPADKAAPAGQEAGKDANKVDEYAEAQSALSGPAGNPECVWLGRRVVNLLWRDDLDTAFRHLDLYDRFGCPGGHVQAAFRCLTRFGAQIDDKIPRSLDDRVHACWTNPNAQPQAAAAPAASTSGSAAPAPAAPASPSATK